MPSSDISEQTTPSQDVSSQDILTIGVRGTAPGCGKDTVADMVVKYLTQKNLSVVRKRFATALKKTVSDYTGIPTNILETTAGKNIVISESNLIPVDEDVFVTTFSEYTGISKFMLGEIGLDDDIMKLSNGKTIKETYEKMLFEFHNVFGGDAIGQTIGKMLQTLGTQLKEIFGSEVFVDAIFKHLHNKDIAVISDVRFKQESEAVKKRFGVIIFVKKDQLDSTQMAGRSTQHSSERDLDGVPADFEIDNNGTYQELEDKVSSLIDKLFDK